MSPDRLGELLSAYLDGELSARQRRAVARWLEQSPAARAQLQQLQEAASALKPLRPRRPRHDLAEPVLHAIAQRRLHPARRLAFGEVNVPTWFGFGVAAAVVLLISTATLVYFALPGARQGRHAEVLAKRSAEPAAGTHPSPGARSAPPGGSPEKPMPAPSAPHLVRQQPKAAVPPPALPVPTKHPDEELASPPAPESRLEVFGTKEHGHTLKLPLRLAGRHPAQQLLREKLKQAHAFRVELRCLGHGKALQRVQMRLRAQGIQLLMDPDANAHSRAGTAKKDLLIYSESLTARDLANLLEQLGAEDDRATQPQDRQFGDLLVSPYGEEDRVQLATLLGVDPTALPAPQGAPLGVDVRKPLEETTTDDLVHALAGKGVPRPGQAPVLARPVRNAIMLSVHPGQVRTEPSKEVRRFLESRKERRPAGMPVLLILRRAHS